MKKGLVVGIILVIVGMFVQISILPSWSMTRVAPNLIVAALIPLALLYGPFVGLSTGFIIGLLLDLITGYGLGLSAIPLCISGFLAGIIKDYINNEHFLMSIAGVIISIIICNLFSMIALYFSRMIITVTWNSIFNTILSMILTSVITIIDHVIIYRGYIGNKRSKRSMYLN